MASINTRMLRRLSETEQERFFRAVEKELIAAGGHRPIVHGALLTVLNALEHSPTLVRFIVWADKLDKKSDAAS